MEFSGIPPLAQALVMAAFRQRTKAPLLFIAKHPSAARDFIDNFAFFAGSEVADRTHYLPAPEFDFYRGLLPNPETLCERNVGLFHAINDPQGRVFVTTVTAFLQKFLPPAQFRRASV
jgi:transcription-repair coupling factor (superfamily II helicase)